MNKVLNNIDYSKLLGFRLLNASEGNLNTHKGGIAKMSAKIGSKVGGKPKPR